MPSSQTVVRQRRPKNRRDLILRAAAELFRDRGYQAVGIDDIGEAVGITGPAVYRHFKSKDEVLLAALDRILDHTLEALDVMPEAHGHEAVALAVQALVSTTMQEWDFAVVFRREAQPLPKQLRLQIRPKRRRIIDYLSKATLQVQPNLGDLDLRLRLEAQYGVLAGVITYGNATHRRRYETAVSHMSADVLVTGGVPPMTPREPALLPAARVSRASRRETVLAAAVELFAGGSYPTVGIDDAGTNAGITGPSVYRHFANKEALLVEASRRMGDTLSVVVTGALGLKARPAAMLEELTQRFVDIAYLYPDLFVVYFNEGRHMGETDLVWYEQQLTTLFDEWTATLCRARPDLSEFQARTVAYGVAGATTRVAATRRLRPWDWREAMYAILSEIQLDNR